MTADDKCSLVNRDNQTQHIQMPLSNKQKTFSGFLFAFFKSRPKNELFEKNMTLIADIFLELWIPKYVVRLLDKCLESLVSEEPSRSNRINGPKHC